MNYSPLNSEKSHMPYVIFIGFDNPPEMICNNTTKWKYSKDASEKKKLQNNQANEKGKTHLNTNNKGNFSKISSTRTQTTNSWLELTKDFNGSDRNYEKTMETSHFIQPNDDLIANLFPYDKKVQNFWKSLNISKDFCKKRETKIENLNSEKSGNIPLSKYGPASMSSLQKKICEVEKKLKVAASYYDSKLD